MELLEVASELVAHHLDMDELYRIAQCEQIKVDETDKNYASDLKNIKIAYAHDQAFPFFYNFEGRENYISFSPLKDKKLPQADLILIGGGYPEDFIADLEMNIDMKESIKSYVEAGGKLIAYGGGLMYLAEKFHGHNMVGIFKGSAKMTDRLQNFGYCEMKAKEDLGFAKAGEILRAREFHRGIFESEEFGENRVQAIDSAMVGKIVNHNKKYCLKGEEKGYFEFGGSTVIILLKENQVVIDNDIIENTNKNKETVVKLGETIGRKYLKEVK